MGGLNGCRLNSQLQCAQRVTSLPSPINLNSEPFFLFITIPPTSSHTPLTIFSWNTSVTEMLQHVLNAAARVVTGTWKFDRGLGQILHDELHWLDVPDWVFFKLAVTVHWCLNGCAPPYLSDYCILAAGVNTQQQLRSTNRQLLAVPHYRLNAYGCRAFFSCWPQCLNSLPDFIWDPTISANSFRRLLRMYLFTRY